MSQYVVQSGAALKGVVEVPGDKSLSHRAVMFGSLAGGVSTVRGWLSAGDTRATLGAMRSLGVQIDQEDAHTLVIHGGELEPPQGPLDLVNAGTGFRLLAGIIAGQSFASILDGSEQLRRRPMNRIITPLLQMGAKIDSNAGYAPLDFHPVQLKSTTYTLPMASAQVKSAILLAGLFADGPTTVIEPGPTRDHTERMLSAMGAEITRDNNAVTIVPNDALQPFDLTVPGDFSSAAFLLVAGVVVPGSDLTIRHVNLNDTRTGLLDVLLAMGASITVTETGTEAGEPVGDLHVQYSDLNGVEIGGTELVVRMIDEFPALMVAALCAEGRTVVRDAAELRVKETDRIAVMSAELRKMGAVIEEMPDGFSITGPQCLTGAGVQAHDDHRVAMSLTVAGLVAAGETIIEDAQCAGDSFPGFDGLIAGLGGGLSVNEAQTSG